MEPKSSYSLKPHCWSEPLAVFFPPGSARCLYDIWTCRVARVYVSIRICWMKRLRLVSALAGCLHWWSFTFRIPFANSAHTKIWSGSFDGVHRFKTGKLGSWLARSVISLILCCSYDPADQQTTFFFFFLLLQFRIEQLGWFCGGIYDI